MTTLQNGRVVAIANPKAALERAPHQARQPFDDTSVQELAQAMRGVRATCGDADAGLR